MMDASAVNDNSEIQTIDTIEAIHLYWRNEDRETQMKQWLSIRARFDVSKIWQYVGQPYWTHNRWKTLEWPRWWRQTHLCTVEPNRMELGKTLLRIKVEIGIANLATTELALSILLAPRMNVSFGFCVDSLHLNERTIKNSYSIVRTYERIGDVEST